MDKKLLGFLTPQLDACDLAQQAFYARNVLSQQNLNKIMSALQTVYGAVNSLPADAVKGVLQTKVKGQTLKNEPNYTPSTWAEWTKSAGVTGDATGLVFTSDAAAIKTAEIVVIIKPSVKYGSLYYVAESTITGDFIRDAGALPVAVLPKTVGNQKNIVTTSATPVNNKLKIYTAGSEANGNKIKIKDLRIFELPAGSEIESDFANLTADQLAAKYPFITGDVRHVQLSQLRSVGKNLFDKSKVTNGYHISTTTGGTAVNITYTYSEYIKIKPNTAYMSNKTHQGAFYDANKNYISGFSTQGITTPANAVYLRTSCAITDVDVMQLETGTVSTSNEPYKDTSALTPVTLRKVGTVADDFVLETGVLTKRVSDSKVVNGGSTWVHTDTGTNTYRFDIASWATSVIPNAKSWSGILAFSADGDYLIGSSGNTDARQAMVDTNGNITIRVEKTKVDAMAGATTTEKLKAYLNQYPITLFYQLATPVISRFQPQPLIAEPNGTLIVEPTIRGSKKPAMGTGKITVSDATAPIDTIRKVERVDVLASGLVQYVDVTASCTISDSGTTITITGYDPNKQYIYECGITSWCSCLPTIEYQYPQADYLKFGVASHDYQAAVADWVLTEAERKCKILMVTNAGGTVNIIIPNTAGEFYMVKNSCGYNAVVKSAGAETGTTIATGDSVLVFNGGE